MFDGTVLPNDVYVVGGIAWFAAMVLVKAAALKLFRWDRVHPALAAFCANLSSSLVALPFIYRDYPTGLWVLPYIVIAVVQISVEALVLYLLDPRKPVTALGLSFFVGVMAYMIGLPLYFLAGMPLALS